jgi:epoxide hydrolase-like predicted phosphatase
MIKALIFDFAGVIGTEGYSLWAREKKSQGIESNSTYFHDISNSLDRGDITQKEFTDDLAKRTGGKSDKIWGEIFNKIIINKELLNYISILKKKYKIGLLTNYNHNWMNEMFSIYKLEKYFDSKAISSLLHVIKPEKKIYEISLELLKVKPEEALFFDDRPRNVAGGENVGIRSFLFTDNKKFIEDLKTCGITI